MLVVPFVLLAAAIAILAGVVATAQGRGGELTLFHRDVPAQRLRLTSAADVARLRLPTGLFGYQEQATSDVLYSIADLLARQEAEIASLRDEVWRLSAPIKTGSVPAESGPVPVGTGSVPADSGPVPVGTGSVPAESGPVLVESGPVLVESGSVPVGTGSVPVESGSVPVGTGYVSVEAGGAADRDGAPDQPQPPL